MPAIVNVAARLNCFRVWTDLRTVNRELEG